jgi:hypothetical protein
MWAGSQNPFRKHDPEEEAESAIEVLIKLALALGLVIFAGFRPDADFETGLLLAGGFLSLSVYAFGAGSYLELAAWVAFAGLAQPVFVPDFPEWLWQTLSYTGAFLLLLSWLLPVYLRHNSRRVQGHGKMNPQPKKQTPKSH